MPRFDVRPRFHTALDWCRANWKVPALWLFFMFVVWPFRPIVTQDDAAYAQVAIRLSVGQFAQHPMLLAAAWPQAFLGAFVIKFLPVAHTLILLNGLIWIMFSVLFFFAARSLVTSDDSRLAFLSYFSFPLFLQYAGGFMSEMPTMLLIGALMLLVMKTESEGSRSWCYNLALTALTILLILQRQTMAAFPALFALLLSRVRKPLAFGVLVGLILYPLFPVSLLQRGYLGWWLGEWMKMGILQASFEFVVWNVELWFALGLFLIPFGLRHLSASHEPAKEATPAVLMQLAFVSLLFISFVEPLSSGLLFLNYLPRMISVVFLSFGAWGLMPLVPWASRRALREEPLLAGTLTAIAMIIGFSSLLAAADIKYAMPLSVPLAFWLLARDASPSKKKNAQLWLKARWIYLGILILVSSVANRYYFNTAEARWRVAEDIRATGFQDREISASYGRDFFELGWPCVDEALRKISRKNQSEAERRATIDERVYSKAPRLYDDGRISQMVIKPGSIFGYELNLSKNRQAGQEKPPAFFYPYTVFGIQNSLNVYENGEGHPAWCDEQEQ